MTFAFNLQTRECCVFLISFENVVQAQLVFIKDSILNETQTQTSCFIFPAEKGMDNLTNVRKDIYKYYGGLKNQHHKKTMGDAFRVTKGNSNDHR